MMLAKALTLTSFLLLLLIPSGVQCSTPAILTLNSFQKGGSGGGPSACDNEYHSDSTLVVALSTGWFDKGSMCGQFIKIMANGNSVKAKVVDECDSNRGCRDNIVDASKAVWKALGISQGSDNWGEMRVTWTDA